MNKSLLRLLATTRFVWGNILGILAVPATLFVIGAGYASSASESTAPGRWYTYNQVKQGEAVYQTHCAVCHGDKGQGATNWRTRGPLGFYPAPPLNGSGHAWHHSLEQLLGTVANGGALMGGNMPAFSALLSNAEQIATVAYFQSLWSDEVYARWNR